MLHAVMIGVNRYQDSAIGDLYYANADALRMARLVERGLPREEREVHLLLDKEATKRNIMVLIGEDLPRVATTGDIVMLYFAGHGSPETSGDLNTTARYLVTHDTEFENIFATGINMEHELDALFRRLRQPRLILMLIDACFSGGAGGRTFEGPRLHKARADTRTTRVPLNKLDIGEGRLMISACDDHEVARESSTLAHGVFTFYLVATLTTGSDGEPTIGIHTLYEQVATQVRRHTRGRQVPIINGRSRIARIPRLSL